MPLEPESANSVFGRKIADSVAKDDYKANIENGSINLNTGLNLTDFIVEKSHIDRMKKRQYEAIDHNEKPEGECAYYSILLGILNKQQGLQITAAWRQPWELVEVQIRPVEVLNIVKRFKSVLKLCLKSTLVNVVCELNDLLEPFGLLFSMFQVKVVVNFVRLFNNTNTKCIKNNVSLFSKNLLPTVEKKAVKVVQLTLSMPKEDDTEIDCSFLRNPHYASLIVTYDKMSKIVEANKTIELNDPNRVLDKPKMKGAFDRIFSCALCMNGFVRRKAYDEHIRTCAGPKTTRYTFNEEEYTLFKDQNRTDPPPFDMFFDTKTPIDDDKCTEPTLLLGSYAIVVVFSDNILASKNNSLENFTCFRSKKMDVDQVTKQLVPNFMLSSIKEEDARAVYIT